MTSYTNDWGLPKPDVSDLIAGSNDNLRRDIGRLADKTDQSLTQAKAQVKDELDPRFETIEEITESDPVYSRGIMPENSDANDFTTAGVYYTGGGARSATIKNLAFPLRSTLLVFPGSRTYAITQMQAISSDSHSGVYYRTTTDYQVWSPWKLMSFSGGTLPANSDADEVQPGSYYTGSAVTVETHANLAEPVPSSLLVIGSADTSSVRAQIQIPLTTGGMRFWFRTKTSLAWSPWVNLADRASGGGADYLTPPPPAGAHSLRLQVFKDEYPLYDTQGKGVVVFRYDHGLSNLKQHLLPLHRQYDIPFHVAMNSRTWDEDQNSGATQADARNWIAEGIAEFSNHTADHKDRDTAEGIYDNIVNGRKELEDQLETTIHGFIVPGVSEFNKFEGFGTGTLDGYTDTYAGGLILTSHAICSGVIGPFYRPLDGVVRQGQRHTGWESSDFDSVKARIDMAADTGTAVVLMAHPSVLGQAGNFDTTLADQVLAYVRTKIDAGELANISYYQSHHATAQG